MGSVEVALEVNGENDGKRVVALKRLLPHAVRDPRRAEMFRREARLAILLDHPNIVRAYDWGELDGEMFIAMEYVEGQPLSRVLRKLADEGERLSPELVAHVLAEICEGLEAAHDLAEEGGRRLKVVHRDVSPQNVMIGYDGSVKLLDFGVAKTDTECVTKTGEVKGKTAYMSPEQAMGDPLDRRSDLFGVGAILFECFALRRMWGAGTDMDILRKLALEKPPPLSRSGAPVPLPMAKLYDELVARDAKDRPESARIVADRLRPMARLDDPSASLRALLQRHFGDLAAEQRQRLRAALAGPPKPSSSSEARREPAPPARRPLVVAAVAMIAVALAGWRVSARGDATPPPAPPIARSPEETTTPAMAPAPAGSIEAVSAKRGSALPPTRPAVISSVKLKTPPPPSASSRPPLDVDPTPF